MPKVAPLKKENWSVRRATASDREGILKLHERAFQKKMTPSQWDWQFLQNPYLQPLIWIAETPSGQIVGHYAVVPVPFRMREKQTHAGYSILSMIDPDFQRQGMFQVLEGSTRDTLEKIDMGLVAGFPNENSVPVYTRYLGWLELGKKIPVYFKVIDLENLLESKIGKLAASLIASVLSPLCRMTFLARPLRDPTLIVKKITQLDERYDFLWKKFSEPFHFTTERTRKYFDWRYSMNPKEYEILSVERGNQLLGIAAFRVDDRYGFKMAYLADLIFDPNEPSAAQSLVSSIDHELKKKSVGMITSLVLPHPLIKEVLSKSKFFPIPDFLLPHRMHFGFRAFKTQERMKLANEWLITWSDHDIV